ncbi:semaphorin-2A-like [Tachypleus tridentatus]|uniref:semaphorin-2A-like n=1 Tax=Tachypleus tridentatus TaxID=6853 RepID=UPI003FD32514
MPTSRGREPGRSIDNSIMPGTIQLLMEIVYSLSTEVTKNHSGQMKVGTSLGTLNKIIHTDFADSLTLPPTSVSHCVSKGKSEHYDCRNHIRVIQPIGEGNKLYVCGTNAHNPKDWIIHANLSHIGQHEKYPGIGSGIAKCPFDPEDNSTAVWVELGNPGDLPGLYSGTVAEFTKADTVIFRTDLYDPSTGRRVYPFSRTIKYDSKWLDKPQFVGSYDIGNYVFFFFRESAVEYINCGKNIYTRVARVCKRDTGGKNILNKNWASFVKARLNCSIPGEFPFYFNEIQSVYNDDNTFYAVFTTSSNGLMGSAICTFSLESIQEVFNGKFKEQATSSSAWLPVISVKVPEPRPDSVLTTLRRCQTSVLNFIRGHPLMDSAVTQENGKPVFYKRDVILTKLVVDKLEVDGVSYTVYYAGSVDGRVFKLVQWHDGVGKGHSNVLDIFEATSPEQIHSQKVKRKNVQCLLGPSVHLPCTVNVEEVRKLELGPIQWVHYGRDKDKVLVSQRRDKYIITSHYGLVIMTVTDRDSGRYDCQVGPHTMCTFNITVDTKTCNPPTELEYKKVYSSWCREFEKYKMAMNTWQHKQNKCQAYLNDVIYSRAPSI